MRLNDLSDFSAARHRRKRIGRGIGSGKGKTGGRGVKGQKSRTGVALNGFEGGQMPLHMRLPKRGFNNIFRHHYRELTVSRLMRAIASGKIDAKKEITQEILLKSGVVGSIRDGISLIGSSAKGEKWNVKGVRLTLTRVSRPVMEDIRQSGGTVRLCGGGEESSSAGDTVAPKDGQRVGQETGKDDGTAPKAEMKASGSISPEKKAPAKKAPAKKTTEAKATKKATAPPKAEMKASESSPSEKKTTEAKAPESKTAAKKNPAKKDAEGKATKKATAAPKAEMKAAAKPTGKKG